MAKMATLRASERKTFSLGLVGINMSLMPAFDDNGSSRPERNMLCPQHKCRVKQHYRCEKENHVVEKAVYGVKHPSKDGYIIVDETEWQGLAALTSATMEFKAWVNDLDPMICETPYFLWPGNVNDQDSRQRFGLLIDLLERKGGWLLVTTSGDHGTARMYAVGVHPEHRILVAIKTRHMSKLRVKAIEHLQQINSDIPVPTKQMKAQADLIFESLPKQYDMSEVKDTLADAQWAYLHAKAAGTELELTPQTTPVPSGPTLEDQLRKTIEQQKAKKPKVASKPRARKAKA